jgi:hypothetical protein
MEPDATYVVCAALPYDLSRDIWCGRDHHAVKLTWHRSDIAVTLHTLDLRGLGVERKYLVAGISELAEHGVGGLAWLPGDARYREAPSTEKRGY